MLNAFRRHGRIHTIRPSVWPQTAPVLNAFRRHGRIHWSRSVAAQSSSLCSTPFGVMVGFTVRNIGKPCSSGKKCSTPFGVMVGFTGLETPPRVARAAVLNAFRRHGRIHSRARRRSRQALMVLNAFRRHGRIHRFVPRPTWVLHACSTPFGVMVGFTGVEQSL